MLRYERIKIPRLQCLMTKFNQKLYNSGQNGQFKSYSNRSLTIKPFSGWKVDTKILPCPKSVLICVQITKIGFWSKYTTYGHSRSILIRIVFKITDPKWRVQNHSDTPIIATGTDQLWTNGILKSNHLIEKDRLMYKTIESWLLMVVHSDFTLMAVSLRFLWWHFDYVRTGEITVSFKKLWKVVKNGSNQISLY